MPLDRDQAAEFVGEALHAETKKTAALAEVLYRKSCGNPLFLGQLLMLVYDKGFLYFDTREGFWKWKLEAIQKLQPGEDVLELFIEKLQRLPEEAWEMVKLAASIGNSFDLKTLAAVSGGSTEETASRLTPSIREGLVLIAADQEELPASVHSEIEYPVFEFLHDRVQQAAYSLIPEAEKKEETPCHRTDAFEGYNPERAAKQAGGKNTSCDGSFQPQPGVACRPGGEDGDSRIQPDGGGGKAKASGAYDSALRYFRACGTLLPEAAWECAYKLCYDLHMELAQMEYLSANAAAAEELFDTVTEKARTELERMEVYGLKVVLLAGMGKYSEAVKTGIGALNTLGIKLPVPPGKLDYARELLLYRRIVFKYRRREQAGPFEAGDAVRMTISELLARLACIISIYDPRAYVYTIIKFSNHAIRYGKYGYGFHRLYGLRNYYRQYVRKLCKRL